MRRKRIIRIGIQNTLPANYAQNQLEPHRDETKHDFNHQRKSVATEEIKKIIHVIVLWIFHATFFFF